MSLAGISVEGDPFEAVSVNEAQLEGLLRTHGSSLFPGFEYFDFRPVIRCVEGSRHPDGALLARGESEWWVVEVETHGHSVENHIEPQLSDLASGHYGPEAISYLERNCEGFDLNDYPIDPYQPKFLLVVDSLTQQIASAAMRTQFRAVECAVFRSKANRYALTVSSNPPQVDSRGIQRGRELALVELEGMACLEPVGGNAMRAVRGGTVVLNGRSLDVNHLADGKGIVLPIRFSKMMAEVSDASRFVLSPDGKLTPKIDAEGG